jgi:hypothetical protein
MLGEIYMALTIAVLGALLVSVLSIVIILLVNNTDLKRSLKSAETELAAARSELAARTGNKHNDSTLEKAMKNDKSASR